jgi:hypothetical protein
MVGLMIDNLPYGAEYIPNRVNIRNASAIRRWTDKFGCSKKQLEQAVDKVGSTSGAVRAELGRQIPLRRQ